MLISCCDVWDRRNKVESNGFPTSLMLCSSWQEENGAGTDTERTVEEGRGRHVRGQTNKGETIVLII